MKDYKLLKKLGSIAVEVKLNLLHNIFQQVASSGPQPPS